MKLNELLEGLELSAYLISEFLTMKKQDEITLELEDDNEIRKLHIKLEVVKK